MDADGNLIPIYDPATTRVLPDGTVVRQPFPGNVIPADRITPEARQFLQFLPQPTSGGPLNNYLVPDAIPDTILGDSDYYFGRFDMYVGQKDHFAVSLWHQRAPGEVLLDPAPRARQRDLLRPAELLGQPLQLGPHLQPEPPEPLRRSAT